MHGGHFHPDLSTNNIDTKASVSQRPVHSLADEKDASPITLFVLF